MDRLQHHLRLRSESHFSKTIFFLYSLIPSRIMIFFLDFCPFLGEQHQPVRCFEVDVGVVDESLCDPDSRPEDRHRKCKNMDCPARS